jgi:hypothetical protein
MVYYIRNYFINKNYTNELMLSVNEMKQTMICKKQSQYLNSNIISTKTLKCIKPQKENLILLQTCSNPLLLYLSNANTLY